VPKPDLAANHMTFEQWVKMYPGMGFVLTAKKEHVEELVRRFAAVGMTAQVIGTVDTTRRLRIRYDGNEAEVFDFIENGITCLSPDEASCRQQ
jgi:selenophosphate synthetase-related protein